MRKRTAASLHAEEKFRLRLNELGATLLEAEWLGWSKPHKVRCVEGHVVSPCPGKVITGQGVCMKCARSGNARRATQKSNASRSFKSQMRFNEELVKLNAELLEMKWRGVSHRYQVRCWCGYEGTALARSILSGLGFCLACVGRDPKAAEARFFARLVELGATPMGPYKNSKSPIKCICVAGHACASTPDWVSRGNGICKICAGIDPDMAQRKFVERVTQLGGEVLDSEWTGNQAKYRVRCSEGHVSPRRPNGVVYGGSPICNVCSGTGWDLFYVVVNHDDSLVKFGISNGDGRNRLSDHASDGYRTVVRVLRGLDDGCAWTLERITITTLRAAGLVPVRGREYFDIATLALILDVVDNYPLAVELTA